MNPFGDIAVFPVDIQVLPLEYLLTKSDTLERKHVFYNTVYNGTYCSRGIFQLPLKGVRKQDTTQVIKHSTGDKSLLANMAFG